MLHAASPSLQAGASEHPNGTSKWANQSTPLAQNADKQPGNCILASTLNFSKRKVHSGQQNWVSRPPRQIRLILNWEIDIWVNASVSVGLVSVEARPGVTAQLSGCWQARFRAGEKHCRKMLGCLHGSGIFPETILLHQPPSDLHDLHLGWEAAPEANCRPCLHTLSSNRLSD